MIPVGERSDQFPYSGPVREKLRFLLRFAVLAPSTHNTQPWIFKLNEDRIEIYADRSRSLPHIDPKGRELTMSVGAAIDHLRLAMVCHLMEPDISLMPDPGRPDLLAVVATLGDTVPTSEQMKCFAQINHRHTYRGAFDERPLGMSEKGELLKAVNDGTAGLLFLEDDGLRRRIGEMVRLGDQALLGEPEYRKELGHWIRKSRKSEDGIPASALGIGALRSVIAPWAVAHIDCGAIKAELEGEQIAHAPALAIVCTRDDGPADWLLAGMAISRLTLAASVRGLRCSFYLQPIHMDEFRKELKAATQALGYPQIVLRLGYAATGAATPRRPLDDMLVERRERHEKPDGGH